MGIWGLGPAIGQYGVLTSLEGSTVVIDGPSLIYRIYEGCLCRKATSNSFASQPSYSTVGRLVVTWLEVLQRHNVTIRKIYFDGYLPPSKWPVRQERVRRQTQHVVNLLASYPYGSLKIPPDTFETIKFNLDITRLFGFSYKTSPKAPFMIPAVIDILRSCGTLGPLVQVVAGEADAFCAEDVRHNGGTIFTGDSDMFVTDLGPDGNVSFLSDVAKGDQLGRSRVLMSRIFSIRATNELLRISEAGGISRVAFDMMSSSIKFQEALERAKKNKDRIQNSSEFKAFLDGYSMKEHLPTDHPVQGLLSSLDPRVSEIIIQTVLLDGDGNLANSGETHDSRGPEALSMFLPIMIEKRDRKSTWTMSTDVRQLAYGIMQSLALQSSAVVIEYRTLSAANASNGREVVVPNAQEVLEQCISLTDTIKRLAKRLPSVKMRWLAFAIYQDIAWSNVEDQPPLSTSQIWKATENSSEHSWDIIHFAAQVQASLYSLRILKQILDVVTSLHPTQPPPVLDLRNQLSDLPAIAEWPTVDNLSHKLAAADKAHVLSIITDILGIPAIEPPQDLPVKNKSKKRKNSKNSKNRSNNGKKAKQPPPANPFDVLGDASQH
ncbi:hypothetical protein GGS21DRAFT_547544 [Xylaria nigripes]|nr:hypothetical protein GGS21DRAFT_547544 [Xylaria nigripes]